MTKSHVSLSFIHTKMIKRYIISSIQTFDVIRNNVKKVEYGDLSRLSATKNKMKTEQIFMSKAFAYLLSISKSWLRVVMLLRDVLLELALISYSELLLFTFFPRNKMLFYWICFTFVYVVVIEILLQGIHVLGYYILYSFLYRAALLLLKS